MLLLVVKVCGVDVGVKLGGPVSLMWSRPCLVVHWEMGRMDGLGILEGYGRVALAFALVGGCDMMGDFVLLLENGIRWGGHEGKRERTFELLWLGLLLWMRLHVCVLGKCERRKSLKKRLQRRRRHAKC
jgi:hypothetical protein